MSLDEFHREAYYIFYNEFKDIIPINKDLYKSFCIFINQYVRE